MLLPQWRIFHGELESGGYGDIRRKTVVLPLVVGERVVEEAF